MAGPKKREARGPRASKSERQPWALGERPGCTSRWSLWFACTSRGVCGGVPRSAMLGSCYGVRCCGEQRPLLTAQSPGGITCHVCHVKAQLRALSQRDPRVSPGDPDISYSFTLGLTCSQTSHFPHSRAEGPTPGQAQLLTGLLINDC